MSDRPPVKIPRIARTQSRAKVAPVAIFLGVVGTAVFAGLASNRAEQEEQTSSLPPLTVQTSPAPLAPPPPTVPAPAPATIPTVVAPPPPPAPPPPVQTYPTTPVTRFTPSDRGAADREREKARVSAPALIVDLTKAGAEETLSIRPAVLSSGGSGMAASMFIRASMQTDPTAAAIAAAGPPPGASAAPQAVGSAEAPAVLAPVVADPEPRDLNPNERFASRAGKREVEVARAELLPNQNMLVPQGTIIGAVMETALNSDLPGFARAVVSRDVLSFDGSQVMIPAGSHVIGEYNSGVAQGASRIFIVWNRLIRPDGVSIALASPAVDDLGRGGLGGKVNRHFFQRFGSAILLSVLSGGINAFVQSRSRGSTVVVSNTNEATSLAGQATRGADISPTITTRQGATVQIFVAQDLDFSAVGAAG